jgi:hypothetical protein
MGLGPIEGVALAAIVFVLFGPTLLAFWLGYTLGRRKDDSGPTPPESSRDEAE